MTKKEKNDFVELVRSSLEVDEEDLRILLKLRIERPGKSFWTMVTLAIPLVMALIALDAFYTLPGYVIGYSFLVYLVALVILTAASVEKNEVKKMRQYLLAKKMLGQREKASERSLKGKEGRKTGNS